MLRLRVRLRSLIEDLMNDAYDQRSVNAAAEADGRTCARPTGSRCWSGKHVASSAGRLLSASADRITYRTSDGRGDQST